MAKSELAMLYFLPAVSPLMFWRSGSRQRSCQWRLRGIPTRTGGLVVEHCSLHLWMFWVSFFTWMIHFDTISCFNIFQNSFSFTAIFYILNFSCFLEFHFFFLVPQKTRERFLEWHLPVFCQFWLIHRIKVAASALF